MMTVLALTTSTHLFLLSGLIYLTSLFSINNRSTRVLCFTFPEPHAVNFRRRPLLPPVGRLTAKNNDNIIIGYSANKQFTHSRIATSTTTCAAAAITSSSSHTSGGGGTSLDRLDATNNNSTTANSSSNTILWDVYICESKQCKERGSAETFGAFVGLAPPHIVAM